VQAPKIVLKIRELGDLPVKKKKKKTSAVKT